MIDFHCHILPGIDDGAANLVEALALEEQLLRQGVDRVVCTPHFDPTVRSLENFIETRAASLAMLKDSKLSLLPASETCLHEYLFHYQELTKLCIPATRYLLIELPFTKRWSNKTWMLMQRLKEDYDIIPIIAHVERYPAVWHQKSNLKRLRELGCVLQVNASSVLDPKLWKRICSYLKKDYIDILGSDCHNCRSRPPVMTEAIKKLKERFGDAFIAGLDTNAEQILRDIPWSKGTEKLSENILY